jgi:hypothetical protein
VNSLSSKVLLLLGFVMWTNTSASAHATSDSSEISVKTNIGIVYVIDGAGGAGYLPHVLKRKLAKSPFEVEQFKWGKGFGHIIADLTDRENIDKKSLELSSKIREYKSLNPDKHIYVVAKSAGTIIALLALSHLEANAVDRAVLLSPAVSPRFDLDPALRAVRRDLISFWSPLDWFYLGFGTSVFGTADGVHCRSAGLVGFDTTNTAAGEKFKQVKWRPSMVFYLHPGTHFGNSMPPFVTKFVLPLLEDGSTPPRD